MKTTSTIKFNGTDVTTDETLTPTLERLVVLKWLETIDKRLLPIVKENGA